MDLAPLFDVAREQRDLLRRDQLVAAGIGRHEIDNLVRRRRLHAVHEGVYSLGVHRDRQDRWLAAVLACGPGAVLSHRCAAAHWGFLIEPDGLVEVSAARSRVGPPGVVVHRPRSSPPRTMWRGIPVTPALRTLVDLADVLSFDALLTAAMEADHQRRVDLRKLRPIAGRRGAPRVRRLLEYVAEGSRSEFEHLARELFADLPPYEADVRVRGSRKLDCVWREHRVAVECNSYAHHTQRRKFEADHRTPLLLEPHGWTVIQVTWRQLRREPRLVRAAVTSALRRHGWAGPAAP